MTENRMLDSATVAVVELTQYAAVQLFIERAQAVKADFGMTDGNASAIAEICHRLDGLPLAIELAAPWVKLFPPPALLTRLESRLKLLTAGARDLPARQQTIRNTIDWSYQLLEPDEQRLFARLGVFVGGCTLEAAEAICIAPDNPQLDVLDGLAALVDQSLVRQDEGLGGEPRFTMLETIREHALEQLEASGEAEMIGYAHAKYYLAIAKGAEPALDGGPDREAWLAKLKREHGNFRGALVWCLSIGNEEVGGRLMGALLWFWFYRGYWSEGREWYERALTGTNGLMSIETRALVLTGAGSMALIQGDFIAARQHFEQSVANWREIGNKRGLSLPLLNRAIVALHQGDYVVASALLEETLDLYRDLGNTWGCAITLLRLGDAALGLGDCTTARVRFEECLAAQQETKDRWLIASALNNLGEAARYQGDYTRATNFYEESLALYREQGNTGDIARVTHNLGYVALHQGNYDQAAALFTESLTIFQKLWSQRGIAECLAGVATLAIVQGLPEQAVRLFGAAEKLLDAIAAVLWPADRLEYNRNVATARAQLDEVTFATAWAAGQAMPFEQAIAYALEGHIKYRAMSKSLSI